MAEIGVNCEVVEVLNGGDIGPDGRLLSVAEIQQGFRQLLTDLRARPAGQAPEPATPEPATPEPAAAVAPPRAAEAASTRPDAGPATSTSHSADLDAGWVTVLAAHAGAGASTIALAIADAAAASGQAVHLVESAHPSRSGLVATSSSELGLDPSGAWRRGLRGVQVTIDRRAYAVAPAGWPDALGLDGAATVVDLGLPTVDNLARLATAGGRCVVVSRATVPGVRAAELALDALADTAVVVAVIGPARWPGAVTSSAGPRLRALRTNGQVVTVPIDRRIEVTGPTHSSLPKSVISAGRALLGLVDAFTGAAIGDDSNAATPPAPRIKKGIRR